MPMLWVRASAREMVKAYLLAVLMLTRRAQLSACVSVSVSLKVGFCSQVYPAQVSFKIEDFPRLPKTKEFMITKSDLQEILKGTLSVEWRYQKCQYRGRKHISD